MKVLIVEDDKFTREGLQEILDSEGYETRTANNGLEGLKAFEEWAPDFLCLDVMMPEMNGFDLCRQVRSRKEDVPIIFISAKSEEIDKVIGLELGADDFIVKPFGVKEVVARIRAVTRRYLKSKTGDDSQKPFEFGKYVVHPNQLSADSPEKKVDLSLREVKILQTLVANTGCITTREVLFKECWGLSSPGNTRTLDQHIAKLRKKIEENPKDPTLILTVHGMGYRYDVY
jgi:two-component system alkaline phosphatase synthesis response regulator PhoP